MALQSDGVDTSYLNLTATESTTNFWFTGIFNGQADDPSGEQDLISFGLAAPFNYLSIRYDVSGATRENLRLATQLGYYELAGTAGALSDWFGLGLACSGTGGTDFLISFKANSTATPVTFTRSMDGGTWTPDYLRVFMGQVRGSAGCVQNIKYGDGYRSLAQLADEYFTTSNVHTGGTPALIPMVTGTADSQRGAFTIAGNVTTVTGPLDTTGGSAPVIAISAISTTGDDINISGTYTSTGGGPLITLNNKVSSSTVQQIYPAFSGGTWSTSFKANTVGSNTVDAVISDSNGTNTVSSSAVTVVGISGTDSLPYEWPATSLTITPSTLTVEVGKVAPLTVTDQTGALVRGATVAVPSVSSAPATTDVNGRVAVTGGTIGSGQATIQALNLAGATISANATITVIASTSSTVTVSPSVASVGAGQSIDFDATVTGSSQGVTWSVQSGTGSIDSNGTYSGGSAGAVTIRATSVEFPASFGDAALTVTASTANTSLSANFLSDATQSAQRGALINYTLTVTSAGIPVSGATITATPSQSAGTLTITSGTTDVNGRANVSVAVGDGSPVDTTIVITFVVSTTGGLSTQVLGYLQILELLYGETELRGVNYARPRARNI